MDTGRDGGGTAGAAREFFFDEAGRRVSSLLEDLWWFSDRYKVRPPPWTFERVAALRDLLDGAGQITTGALDESISDVTREISNALVDLVATIEADRPIPYTVTRPLTTPNEPIPAPSGLYWSLKVLRGGRA